MPSNLEFRLLGKTPIGFGFILWFFGISWLSSSIIWITRNERFVRHYYHLYVLHHRFSTTTFLIYNLFDKRFDFIRRLYDYNNNNNTIYHIDMIKKKSFHRGDNSMILLSVRLYTFLSSVYPCSLLQKLVDFLFWFFDTRSVKTKFDRNIHTKAVCILFFIHYAVFFFIIRRVWWLKYIFYGYARPRRIPFLLSVGHGDVPRKREKRVMILFCLQTEIIIDFFSFFLWNIMLTQRFKPKMSLFNCKPNYQILFNDYFHPRRYFYFILIT